VSGQELATQSVPAWLKASFPEHFESEPTTQEAQEFLKARQTTLHKMKGMLTQEATREVNTSLEEVTKALSSVELELRKNNLAEYRKIERLVGIMSRMSLRLFVEKNFDLGFEVKNHVQWLEWKPDGTSASRTWRSYASDERDGRGMIPYTEVVERVYEEIREIYVNKFAN